MPTDLESVIEKAIAADPTTASADAGGEPAEPTSAESGPEPGAAPSPVVEGSAAPTGDGTTEKPVADAKGTEDDDDLSKIPSHIGADGKQRENRIPHSRVQKIVARAEKLAVEAATKPLAEKVTTLETRQANFDRLGEIAATDADRFMAILASQNPAYKKFLATPPAASADNGQPKDAGAVPTTRPEPDADLPDGSKTYSLDGIGKLLDWHAAQVESRVSKRYEPIEKTFKTNQILSESAARVRAQITEAQTWPAFADHQDAIVALLKQDSAEAEKAGRRPTLTLDAAYRQIVIPTLKAERTTMRTELLEELKKQPTSTAIGAKPPVVAKVEEEPERMSDRLDSVIRASIAKIK